MTTIYGLTAGYFILHWSRSYSSPSHHGNYLQCFGLPSFAFGNFSHWYYSSPSSAIFDARQAARTFSWYSIMVITIDAYRDADFLLDSHVIEIPWLAGDSWEFGRGTAHHSSLISDSTISD
jgi:hypothetical protein